MRMPDATTPAPAPQGTNMQDYRLAVLRAQIGRCSRAHKRYNDPSTLAALTAAKIEYADAKSRAQAQEVASYVRRVVEAAPPLSPATRDRLALLLAAA